MKIEGKNEKKYVEKPITKKVITNRKKKEIKGM
jgi:hypothetical protein